MESSEVISSRAFLVCSRPLQGSWVINVLAYWSSVFSCQLREGVKIIEIPWVKNIDYENKLLKIPIQFKNVNASMLVRYPTLPEH